jgi:hypothetical protein
VAQTHPHSPLLSCLQLPQADESSGMAADISANIPVERLGTPCGGILFLRWVAPGSYRKELERRAARREEYKRKKEEERLEKMQKDAEAGILRERGDAKAVGGLTEEKPLMPTGTSEISELPPLVA